MLSICHPSEREVLVPSRQEAAILDKVGDLEREAGVEIAVERVPVLPPAGWSQRCAVVPRAAAVN